MHLKRTTWPRWLIVGIIVILLTLIAQGHEGNALGPKIRLIPFEEYAAATMGLLRGWEDADRWLSFVLIDGIGNLVVFMPLGAALDYALRDTITPISRRIRVIALLGGALSSTYEITQLWIPGRITAIDDVIINTAGTVLGAAFVLALRLHREKRIQRIT
ncbi:MAG: VanZ family protein [Anaerolineae bacterium]|nr:VanZ family protein [Anaerolineae bacterium]